MGKPKGKDGKIQIRAKEYKCPACGFTMEKGEFEDTLTASIAYTCPYCNNTDETQVPFLRKKVARLDEESGKKKMIETVRFVCSKCKKNLDITKKMK